MHPSIIARRSAAAAIASTRRSWGDEIAEIDSLARVTCREDQEPESLSDRLEFESEYSDWLDARENDHITRYDARGYDWRLTVDAVDMLED